MVLAVESCLSRTTTRVQLSSQKPSTMGMRRPSSIPTTIPSSIPTTIPSSIPGALSRRRTLPCCSGALSAPVIRSHAQAQAQATVVQAPGLSIGFNDMSSDLALAAHGSTAALADASVAMVEVQPGGGEEGMVADSLAAQMAANDPVTNLFITVMFVLAVIGLVVLTGGVSYLAYSDWRDKRELEELEKKAMPEKRGKAKEELAAPKESPLGAAKGFGKKMSSK